jgi:2-aminoadipate transaminase
MHTIWEDRYADRVRRMKSSAIRELLKITELPGCISFAGGLPAPESFPVEEIAAVTERILREQSSRALQYGATEGYYPLRELIARQLSSPDLTIHPENVLITSGSQQALDLLGRVFLDPDDTLLVEAPTYLGALQAWSPYGVRYQTIATDQDGIQVEQLEAIIQHHAPKWLYVLPNFQNPSGVTLSLARRERLVELAARYHVAIVEDDPYGHLRFTGEPLPSLLHVAARSGSSEQVLYLGTFSKILSPGLRLGWIVAPSEVIGKLVQAKQGVDLHTSTLNQMIAYAVASSDFLPGHIQSIRQLYSERRELMLAALQQHFPASVQWTRPAGGLFLWVTLPPEVNAADLLPAALAQNVAFVPGEPFFANGGGQYRLRLNFSNASPEQIETGIARLGQVLQTYIHPTPTPV